MFSSSIKRLTSFTTPILQHLSGKATQNARAFSVLPTNIKKYHEAPEYSRWEKLVYKCTGNRVLIRDIRMLRLFYQLHKEPSNSALVFEVDRLIRTRSSLQYKDVQNEHLPKEKKTQNGTCHLMEMWRNNERVPDRCYDYQQLLKLPENTLGHKYAKQMIDLGFNSYGDWEALGVDRDDLDLSSYAHRRWFEVHDIVHILLDYNLTAGDECLINFFFFSQYKMGHNITFPMIAMARIVHDHYGELPTYFDGLMEARQRGKHAVPLLGQRIENMLEMDLEEARRELHIIPRKGPRYYTNNNQVDWVDWRKGDGVIQWDCPQNAGKWVGEQKCPDLYPEKMGAPPPTS
eukprot:405286_1